MNPSLLALVVGLPARGAEITDTLRVLVYADVEVHEGTVGPVPEPSGFRQHHANLIVDGRPNPLVQVRVNFEFEDGGQEPAGPTGRDAGAVITEEAVVALRPTPWLELSGGRVMSPYGHYNPLHDISPAFWSVSTPAIVHPTKLGGNQHIPKLTTGLRLRLGAGAVRGQLAVDNGPVDGNSARGDDNRDKGLLVRVETAPGQPVGANLTGYRARVEGAGVMWSGVAAATVDIRGWSAVLESHLTQLGASDQLGGSAELASLHLDPVVLIALGEALSIQDTWTRRGSVGLALRLGGGHAIVKLEHAYLWVADEPPAGQLNGALVGWF